MRQLLLSGRRWWLGALAFAGVVVTHAVSYRLAVSDHRLRDAILHESGHAIWPSFIAGAALAALVIGLAGSLTRSSAVRGSLAVRATALRLAALQGAGWLAVEAFERLAAGSGHLSARTVTPVVIGVVVQIVLAIVAALLLTLLGAVVDALIARRQRPFWGRPVHWLEPVLVLRGTRMAAAAWSPRGPPHP